MGSRSRSEAERGSAPGDAEPTEVTPAPGGEAATPAARPRGRARFFGEPYQPPWLPVSEPAFLLWVLAALVLIWIGIAVVLQLT